MSGLTQEQIAKRRHSIGGSDASILMSGDPAAILALWETKTGRREPDDLSRVLPVQMGIWTEPLNRRWYTMTTGNKISEVGVEYARLDHKWLTCTLDGIVEAERAVFEAKHVNAFATPEEVAQKYMAQLHHCMSCTGRERAVLSIFLGTLKYETFLVERDEFYGATLLDYERAFWKSVTTDTPPGDLPQVATPQAGPIKLRTVDMTGNNAWASSAIDWIRTAEPAKTFEKAAKTLKAMVEADVGEACGHGIAIKRARNGSLTIRESRL